MSDSFPEHLPAFISPLTDTQHAQLGRIALLWGQLDFILDELLLNVLNLTMAQRSMFVGEKPMGPKLDLIKPQISTIQDADAKALVQQFYELLNDTKAKRNHAFHGVWGWRAIDKREQIVVCARHPKALHNPVTVKDLPKLEADLCRASNIGFRGLSILRAWDPPKGVARFSHGQGQTPEWYLRWSAQHPLGDHNLDRNCKVGELPRLIDPLG